MWKYLNFRGEIMINDKTLAKLAAVVFAVGIVALFVVVQMAEPLVVEAKDVDEELIGKAVVLDVSVEKIIIKDGHIFIDGSDGTGEVRIVMFVSDAKKQEDVYNVTENDTISVTGKVSLYKGSLEVIASSIERVNENNASDEK